MRFWAGAPVVGLLRAEPDGSVLLLERLEASGPLAERPVDEVAATIGDLVRRLALPDPPGDVPSTAEAARALVEDGPRRWQTLGRPLPVAVLDSAVELARSLADRAPGVAVDGDVHAGQVLRASEGGAWTVVDPLLMRGDPGYDLARSLWTLVDRLPDRAAVRRYADVVVEAAGGSTQRSRGWLVVRTVDYWLWSLTAGLTEDPVRCARVIDALI